MTKEERSAKWEAEFIPCKNHPDRRCNKSRYVAKSSRQCASCRIRNKDGVFLEVFNRHHAKFFKQYRQSEKGKAAGVRYKQSDKGKASVAWYLERKLHG